MQLKSTDEKSPGEFLLSTLTKQLFINLCHSTSKHEPTVYNANSQEMSYILFFVCLELWVHYQGGTVV